MRKYPGEEPLDPVRRGALTSKRSPTYKDNIIIAPLAPAAIFACQGRKAARDSNVSALSPWEAYGVSRSDDDAAPRSLCGKAFESWNEGKKKAF